MSCDGIPISQLPNTNTPYTGLEQLVFVQDNITKTGTVDTLREFISPDISNFISLTGNWENTYITVAAKEFLWDNAYDLVFGSEPRWNSNYTTVQANSACWASTCTTVSANSAAWSQELELNDLADVATNLNTFSIEFVPIGDAGNVADTTTYGAVSYDYCISKFEITEGNIAEYNADPANSTRLITIDSRGTDKPATDITWNECARYVNWLNINDGAQPAYNFALPGINENIDLWTSGEAWQLDGENLFRHKDAKYFIPNENEWYKAAYYKGGGTNAGYWLYPTGSDTAPTAVTSGTVDDTAVYIGAGVTPLSPADVTEAGGLSPYGTMGQGGNVYEHTENTFDGANDNVLVNRVHRGGSFGLLASTLINTHRAFAGANTGSPSKGLRVAMVSDGDDCGGTTSYKADETHTLVYNSLVNKWVASKNIPYGDFCNEVVYMSEIGSCASSTISISADLDLNNYSIENFRVNDLNVSGSATIDGILSSGDVVYSATSNSTQWTDTYSTVSSNSAAWDALTDPYDDSLLQSTSGNWNSAYTTVSANSASWIGGDYDDSLLQSTSGNWNSAYTTVSANSASWIGGDYDDSLLQSTSGDWNSAYDELVSIGLAGNNITNADVISANIIHSISAFTHYQDILVSELSGFSVEGDVSIAGQVDVTGTLSANDIVYALDGNSSQWNNTYTTVQSESSNWVSTLPTLDSVTTNGATTLNDISVGRIVTLHPTNPVNDNVATGNQACAIGGVANQVSGNRSVNYGGRENVVSGNDSSTIGGFGQIVIGQESEGFGSTATTLNTKYTSAVGTINSVVGLSGQGTASTATKHSAVLGGDTNIIESATEAVIIGGDTNTIQSTHHRSVILGGTGIVTDAADTAYVPNLNVGAGFKMPTGAGDSYVLTSDANGVGTWQANIDALQIAASDETTDLTTGITTTFRAPYAMELTDVRASVTTAPVGADITVDVTANGTTIFSTIISIDDGSKTSVGSASPRVISTTSIPDDAEIKVDIKTVGSTTIGNGLKLSFIGYKS